MSVRVTDLRKFYDKGDLTLKDWITFKMCILFDLDAETVERGWQLIFSEAEEFVGKRLEDIPLACLWKEDRGRPPTQKANAVARFLAFAPYSYIRRQELENARNHYTRDLRIKDKRSTYYKGAIRRATCVACMRVRRGYDAFRKAMEDEDPFRREVWALMSEQVSKALAEPEPEAQTVGDMAVSAGIELGRRLRREGRFVSGREKG